MNTIDSPHLSGDLIEPMVRSKIFQDSAISFIVGIICHAPRRSAARSISGRSIARTPRGNARARRTETPVSRARIRGNLNCIDNSVAEAADRYSRL